jgi:hypothetical protein
MAATIAVGVEVNNVGLVPNNRPEAAAHDIDSTPPVPGEVRPARSDGAGAYVRPPRPGSERVYLDDLSYGQNSALDVVFVDPDR